MKPSNILATNDRLNLSSDSIFPIGEKRQLLLGRDLYDAPEMQSSLASAKEDVWSLGITLVETLTHHPPDFPSEQSADPSGPPQFTTLFLVIARPSPRRDPSHHLRVPEN